MPGGDAAPKRAEQKCGDGQSVCNGTCVKIESDAANCGACAVVCPAGARCMNGRCQAR
jgi:hypothetical protein